MQGGHIRGLQQVSSSRIWRQYRFPGMYDYGVNIRPVGARDAAQGSYRALPGGRKLQRDSGPRMLLQDLPNAPFTSLDAATIDQEGIAEDLGTGRTVRNPTAGNPSSCAVGPPSATANVGTSVGRRLKVSPAIAAGDRSFSTSTSYSSTPYALTGSNYWRLRRGFRG